MNRLAAGVVLLMVAACAGVVAWRYAAPHGAGDRPPMVLRARGGNAAAASSGPSNSAETSTTGARSRHALVDQTAFSIMYATMSNDFEAKDERFLCEQLVEALAVERIGTVGNRVRVVQREVSALRKRLAREPKLSGDLSPLQERAIEQEAKRWSRRIVAQLEGSEGKEKPIAPSYPRVHWPVLTGFTYRPGMELPDEVRALDGLRVAIDGYMIITQWGSKRRVEQFLLTESMWGCCFARTPQIHEGIVVDAPKVAPHEGPITVLGVLNVEERVEDGEVVGVYHLDAHRVMPLAL